GRHQEGVPVALRLPEHVRLDPRASVRVETEGQAPRTATLRAGNLELSAGRVPSIRIRVATQVAGRPQDREADGPAIRLQLILGYLRKEDRQTARVHECTGRERGLADLAMTVFDRQPALDDREPALPA